MAIEACYDSTSADLGKGPGVSVPPLFWVKQEEITEGRIASSSLCLDPSLVLFGAHPVRTKTLHAIVDRLNSTVTGSLQFVTVFNLNL